ncbi:MAG: response regulator transcription factor [Ignavibacteriales bacterium]|nr:response regulator transcription factor [Ignavibacteriales bacterium]
MIKILIADDHSIVRQGLKQIVAEENDIVVQGEAGSAEELFPILEKQEFDLIILDINMPGKSGIEILKDISIRFPQIPVLILSMYGEEQYGIRAIKAGAAGYLKKVSAPEELVKAIKKIVGGGKYISPTLAEKLADRLGDKTNKSPHEILSNREYEIMCKIASGKSIEEIAEELSISVPTVYTYRNRIFEKMNLKSNVELTQYVLQNKLID